VEVPQSFPLGLAKRLRGLRLTVAKDEFFPARAIKTLPEIHNIEAALRLTEQGMAAAINMIRSSRVGRDGYLYRHRRRLTSEDVQGAINATIARAGGVAQHTIVAGGNQACDPHETGHGPLRAHWPIIVDIFPRDMRTGCFGDMTRTVVRGRASERVKKMYTIVGEAQELAFARLRDGADGKDIHDAIVALFRREGFPTGRKGGRMQGFFHGTGHGLGLEIHEAPRLGGVCEKLQAGHVVTVEPGLYYWAAGGVRLEDVVVVQKTGCRNLSRFPKVLEV
jgi:Xaa-Pro aminopeptidase